MNLKDEMKVVHRMQAEARAGHCPICGRDMTDPANRQFRDRLSVREYYQSGFCQDCQDDFFDEE